MLQTAMVTTLGAAGERIFTDAQLLALIGRGENWAMSEIYNRYARLVFSIALRTLSDRASADEIVQGVFTKVWQHARDYRVERGKFSTWLINISLHLCIDELRRRRVRPVTQPRDEELLRGLASDDNPWPDTQDAFEQARVREALQQIPIQQRTVIELAFWEGMSQQEIALHCHSPLGTVKTRFRLGMQRLKLLLQETE
jgi:RNA polymerase sigma-70 factor (ECF subfamily)